MAFLTRASLGIPRNEDVNRDVIIMVLMTYLNHSHQSEGVTACVGRGHLSMLLDSDPLYFINLIMELCENDHLIVNDTEECFLNLKPPISYLEYDLLLDPSLRQIHGIEGCSLDLLMMPNLRKIAHYFNSGCLLQKLG